MTKRKKGSVLFSLAAACCTALGVGLSVATPVRTEQAAAAGGEIVLSGDYSAGLGVTATACNYSDIYEYSGVCQGSGNGTYGIVPASVWGDPVSIAPAYVTYKLTADDDYDMASLTANFTVTYGHCSDGAQCFGNADFQVFVSSDNANFTQAYSLYNDDTIIPEGQTSTKGELTGSSNKITQTDYTYKISLDLSQYAVGKQDVYVKAYLKVAENAQKALGNIPVRLYSTALTATQKEIGDISVYDNFREVNEVAVPLVSESNVYEYQNIGHDTTSTFGLVPSTSGWGGLVDTAKAYVTYKLSAVNGYAIDSLSLSANVTFGHGQISAFVAGADIKVGISYDNVSFTDVYSIREDTTICPVGSETPKAAGNASEAVVQYLISLDLTDSINAAGDLYLRITLDCPEREQTSLGQVATTLYDVSIQAGQSKLPAYTLENDWTKGGAISSFEGLVDYGGVAKDTNNGNATFGLVPASGWAATVNASSGYLTYQVSAADGLVFEELKLNMNLIYAKTSSDFADGLANFIVSVSYDKKAFTQAYNLYKEKGYFATSQVATDLTVDLSEYAKGFGVLFVKIDMICPTATVVLNKLPTCLLGVTFNGVQNTLPATAVSLTNDWRNGGTVDSFAGVMAAENVAKDTGAGNQSYALVPATGWAGEVSATTGYVTYKLSAGENKVFKNLRLQLGYTLKSGGELVVYTSKDDSDYTEFLRASAFKNSPYENPIQTEIGAYQTLDVDLAAAVKNLSTAYVKLEMVHPDGQYYLGNLLVRLYTVSFTGDCVVTEDFANANFSGETTETFVVETEGNYFESLMLEMNGTSLSGAKVSVSLDGETYTDLPEVAADTYQADLTDYAFGVGKVYVKTDFSAASGATPSSIRLYGVTAALTGGKIEYVLDGGSYQAGESNPTEFMTSDGVITLVSPVKEYMEFVGWYANSEGTGEPITQIDCSALRAYRLYAKWVAAKYDFNLIVEGEGTVEIDPELLTEIAAGASVQFTLTPADGYILYGLSVNGVDVFLTNGNSYKLSNANCDYTIVAKFAPRASVQGDFSMDYTAHPKFGNGWKDGLYDYANLYITDSDYHSLGINGGVGYITYKFEAEDGKYFESAMLTTIAKLFDYYGQGTNEKVDYYLGYDENDENYELIYKSLITRVGNNIATVKQNLTGYVIGKQAFFLKIVIGSNSTNWTLFQNLDIRFTYQTVELTVNYGDYTEISYEQLRGKPLDTSLIAAKEGYELLSSEVYADAEFTTPVDLNAPVDDDLTVYVKCAKASPVSYTIEYELNGGKNAADAPVSYLAESGVTLKDPTREGYLFSGWYADEALTLLMTEIPVGRTGDIKLYAKWTENTPIVIEPEPEPEPEP
ncbi:MAG: InlB B-repeat-containing protein, partial [Clostridia bacterium]|nr:InlB B-repeat-containing protein [Clostridia bacterium]